ncbi:MAG TPA: hypothetical protein V6C86_26090 [Oculatellaceae cyanobacterium]
MNAKFDVKTQARSMAKLLEMADTNISKPGGAIAAERLIDYTSSELGKLTVAQRLQVLAALDSDYEKNLLRDGHGAVIGYVYSKKVFVNLRPQPDSNDEFAKHFAHSHHENGHDGENGDDD